VTKVLLWHWGRHGAGAKFAYELAQQLQCVLSPKILISAAHGSDLSVLAETMGDTIRVANVATFGGNKNTWRGKLAALKGFVGLPLLAYRFRRMIAENRIDVALCAFQSIWDVAALPTLARGSTRFVLILHDAFFHPGDDYPLRQRILCREIQQADGIVVLSEHVRQQAIEHFGFPADRIWKMHHGVFTFSNKSIQPAVHPRGNRPINLLFFGKILAYKGLDLLLRAHKLLLQQGYSVKLVVAGSGKVQPYAELLRELGDSVELRNYWIAEQEIATLFTACDIAVLPYIEASQSGVAASAYGAGRPVVATPVGGLVEQVIQGTTGVLASDVSVEALANAIAALINDAILFETCARGALQYAMNELSWRNSAECIAGVLSTIMAAPRRKEHRFALDRSHISAQPTKQRTPL